MTRASIDAKAIPEELRGIAESGGPTSQLPPLPPGTSYLDKLIEQKLSELEKEKEVSEEEPDGAEHLDIEETPVESIVPRLSDEMEPSKSTSKIKRPIIGTSSCTQTFPRIED